VARIIVVTIIVVAVSAGVGYWYWRSRKPEQVTPTGLGAELFEKGRNPLRGELPEVNPFNAETNPFEETKTNPLKDVYKNPFGQ
jgi:hypothetical protein